MPTELLLADARIVLADEVIPCGFVAVAEGRIVAIYEGGEAARGFRRRCAW